MSAEPLTVAYIAIGVAEAFAAHDGANSYTGGGECDLVDDCIEWGRLLDRLADEAGDNLTGCFSYEVAQPFGYELARCLLTGTPHDALTIARQMIGSACE